MSKASGQNDEDRIAGFEALATAVERWLADPRYVTEQIMIKALREVYNRKGGIEAVVSTSTLIGR